MVTVEQVVAEAGDLCRRLQASISQVTVNREASETKRQLWASQPALIRLATVWLVLASDDYDHFGLVYAAMFLVQGVHGMPALHVKGYPADAVGFMAQFNATHGHLGWKDKVNKVT
ncbi:MAG: hypothetical protein OK454_09220, partial [Thaumarchaeota archaeon]|nr:hypothetical protein [Nitrososphaerota archaeon]